MDIIGLIIIISIIKKIIDKDKESNKDKQKKQSNDQWQKMLKDVKGKVNEYTSQQNGRQTSYASRSSAGAYAAGNSANNPYYYAQQQKATKERLKQKYGNQTSNSYAKNAGKTDILSRAKENVREEEQDTIKQEIHAEVCSEYRSHAEAAPNLAAHVGHSPECAAEEESDILKRVNDLIVMGYDGDMEFDRDFVAEGVAMLNSFSL